MNPTPHGMGPGGPATFNGFNMCPMWRLLTIVQRFTLGSRGGVGAGQARAPERGPAYHPGRRPQAVLEMGARALIPG
jgi:hypothetical protein